jgi:hypothetical protein
MPVRAPPLTTVSSSRACGYGRDDQRRRSAQGDRIRRTRDGRQDAPTRDERVALLSIRRVAEWLGPASGASMSIKARVGGQAEFKLLSLYQRFEHGVILI